MFKETLKEIEDHLDAFITIDKLANDGKDNFKIYERDNLSISLFKQNTHVLKVRAINDFFVLMIINQESYPSSDKKLCSIAITKIKDVLKQKKIKYKEEHIVHQYLYIKIHTVEEFKNIFNSINKYFRRTLYNKEV